MLDCATPSDERREQLRRDVGEIVRQRLVRFFETGPLSIASVRSSFKPTMDQLIVGAAERLDRETERKVELGLLASDRPEPREGGHRYEIQFHGVNHGVIASNIDTLNVGASTAELRECLHAILDVSRELPEPEQNEIADLVRGIMNEVKQGSDGSKSMVRHAVDRVELLLDAAHLLGQVGGYVERLWPLVIPLVS